LGMETRRYLTANAGGLRFPSRIPRRVPKCPCGVQVSLLTLFPGSKGIERARLLVCRFWLSALAEGEKSDGAFTRSPPPRGAGGSHSNFPNYSNHPSIGSPIVLPDPSDFGNLFQRPCEGRPPIRSTQCGLFKTSFAPRPNLSVTFSGRTR
jgi:hypothetical protein